MHVCAFPPTHSIQPISLFVLNRGQPGSTIGAEQEKGPMIKTNPLELASSVCFLECSSQHCYHVGMLTFVCNLEYALTSKNCSLQFRSLTLAGFAQRTGSLPCWRRHRVPKVQGGHCRAQLTLRHSTVCSCLCRPSCPFPETEAGNGKEKRSNDCRPAQRFK